MKIIKTAKYFDETKQIIIHFYIEYNCFFKYVFYNKKSCSHKFGILLRAHVKYVMFKCNSPLPNPPQDGTVDTHHLTKGNRHFNPIVLFVPAMCDMIATSIMYVGLTLTYASSFQMLRGSVIVFVGILSVAFLERQMAGREWFGIAFVIAGLSVVGAADFLSAGDDATSGYSRNNIITGDLLIILAQIITAVQMVYEERYVAGMDIPALQAVGWEGLFGFAVLGCTLVPMYWIPVAAPFNGNAHGTLEDALDALAQIANNGQLVVALAGTVLSIAFFNFAGISVTKEMSATTRMVLDSVRTLVIWLVSLWIQWQKFHGLQVFGFAALIFGMCVYNNVLVQRLWWCCRDGATRRQNYGDLPEETDAVVVQSRAADEPRV